MQKYDILLYFKHFYHIYCFCNLIARGFSYLCIVKISRSAYLASIGIVLVLLLSLFPHHHHDGGAACWVTEICHSDGQVNDEHTAHHGHHSADSHPCYQQSVSTHLSIVRKAMGGTDGGFLPCDFWEQANTPIIYIGERAAYCLPSPTPLAHPSSKQMSRRGPPARG